MPAVAPSCAAAVTGRMPYTKQTLEKETPRRGQKRDPDRQWGAGPDQAERGIGRCEFRETTLFVSVHRNKPCLCQSAPVSDNQDMGEDAYIRQLEAENAAFKQHIQTLENRIEQMQTHIDHLEHRLGTSKPPL